MQEFWEIMKWGGEESWERLRKLGDFWPNQEYANVGIHS